MDKKENSRFPYLKIVIAAYLLFSFATQACANERERFTGFIDHIYHELAKYEELEEQEEQRATASLSKRFLSGECKNEKAPSLDHEILTARSKETRRDTGLELRGSLSSGPLSDNSDADDGFQRSGGSLELSWNVLKDGFYHSTLQAESLEIQAAAAEVRMDLENLENENRCRRDQIKIDFSAGLLNLLQLKKQFISEVHRIERRAYFKQWSFLDDYLVSEEDIFLVDHEMHTLFSDPVYDSNNEHLSDGFLPPIIEIDLPRVITAIRDDKTIGRVFQLEKEGIEAEQEKKLYDSLRLYLRQEVDFDSSGDEDNDLVAGLRFSLPLHSREDTLLPLRLRQLERQHNEFTWKRIAQTRLAHNGLQEQLRRAVRQQYRYWRALERSRRTLLLLKKGDEQLLTTAITRINTALDARIELFRAVEELYRRVNEVLFKAKVKFDESYIRQVALSPGLKRARAGKRSTYIWSKPFNQLDNQDLRDFLHAKNITRVLLSAGKKTNKVKLDAFLELASESSLSIDIMVGDNSWVIDENHERAIEESLIAAEITGGLHLDIEPQAMADYREKRQDYLESYTRLVSAIKDKMMGRKLSLSVPFHWPTETYERIGSIADGIYVMAYGTADHTTILRRIRPLLDAVPHEKITIVLRVSDFSDEWALEQTIDKLMQETAVEHFGLHHIGNLISLSTSPNEATNEKESY